MPPSSSLERQWSLKSIALRILKHLRFSVKAAEPVVPSNSASLLNTGSHRHTTELTDTFRPTSTLTLSKSRSKKVKPMVPSTSVSPSNTRTRLHQTEPKDSFEPTSTLSSTPVPHPPPLAYTRSSSQRSPSSSPPLTYSPPPLSPLQPSSYSRPSSLSPHLPAPLHMSAPHELGLPGSLDKDAISSEEAEIESERPSILLRKKAAEVSMHEHAKMVHTYQKEFEVAQRAFIEAVTELHHLELRLSNLRNGKSADEDERLGTENHLDYNGPVLYNPSISDSDSDTDSEW